MIFTAATRKGARLEQEDRFIIHKARTGTLFAIMDGHGGKDVAQVCQDYVDTFWDVSGQEREVEKALELVIWQLDTITNEYQSGSTISLAFIPDDEERVFVATLGDSPVIVRSPDGITHVSTSHNARTNLEEREAAIKRGGIYKDGYIWNALGDYGLGLQMTHCLGDGYMGPILSKVAASENYAFGDFVLLATDGVFDPGHQQGLQAINDVIALIDKGADADAVVDRAVQLATGDNATAILIRKGAIN